MRYILQQVKRNEFLGLMLLTSLFQNYQNINIKKYFIILKVLKEEKQSIFYYLLKPIQFKLNLKLLKTKNFIRTNYLFLEQIIVSKVYKYTFLKILRLKSSKYININ